MTFTIEVFYSFQSPYSYLALEPIYQLESRYDVQLLWQPYLQMRSAEPSVPQRVMMPEELSYIYEDTKRNARDMNIPIVFPASWPEVEFDADKVTRGAIVASDLDIMMEYNYKVFHRWWGLGENPNEENFMNELCEELDVDLGDFLGKLSATDTKERVKGIYKRGKKLNVFDTPTLVIDGERFVGIDKLPYVAKILEKNGLRKAA